MLSPGPDPFGRRHSQAVPGVGDCDICFEPVPCVKVLDCGHTLCQTCASRLTITTAKGGGKELLFITCPNCRKNTEFGGIESIKTRYFGQIKCDFCLLQKETDDMWWCPECVRTVCSKCSIKDHATYNHKISEWNALDPVEYGVDYIENVRLARQSSSLASYNRHVVRAFLSKVEESILNSLSLSEDLEQLKENLLSHYGRDFNPAQRAMERQVHRSSSMPGSSEQGPRIVAKLLQIAGQNVSELKIPKESETKFQVYFSIPPEEAAKQLVSKIEFIPFEEGMLPLSRRGSSASRAPVPSAPSAPESPKRSRRSSQEGSSTMLAPAEPNRLVILREVVFERPDVVGTVGQCDIGYQGTVIFRTEKEIIFCDIESGTVKRQKHPIGQQYRHIVTSRDSKILYSVLQSTAKFHEWTLQVTNMDEGLETVALSIDIDIDPEDKVIDMDIIMVDDKTFYEIRRCERQVTEVWRASMVDKRSLGKTTRKLKETSLYQKAGLILYNGQVVVGKEDMLIAYDEVQKTINRYLLNANRCRWLDSIASSKFPPTFCIGSNSQLWVFLPGTGKLLKSYKAITDTGTAPEFVEVFGQPEIKKTPNVMKEINGDSLQAVALSAENVILFVFGNINCV